MIRYVAFLRGINVGGRVVVKETLQQAFTSMGFQNVSTFKQSRNVIFESKAEETEKSERQNRAGTQNQLGL